MPELCSGVATAARIDLQERCASNQLELHCRLPKAVAESFNSPTSTGKPIAPSFFNVSMHQWRSVVRRMVRCKLAVALPSDTCSVAFSGGAFAVPKDEGRDRLISDRRPQNSQESSVNRVFLPFCPGLRRLIVDCSQALGVHIIDTRNCSLLIPSRQFAVAHTSHWTAHTCMLVASPRRRFL